jgi:hypothetical protein
VNVKEIGRGLDEAGSGLSTVAGCCEHGNEPSVALEGEEFLCQLNSYHLDPEGPCSIQLAEFILPLFMRFVLVSEKLLLNQ